MPKNFTKGSVQTPRTALWQSLLARRHDQLYFSLYEEEG